MYCICYALVSWNNFVHFFEFPLLFYLHSISILRNSFNCGPNPTVRGIWAHFLNRKKNDYIWVIDKNVTRNIVHKWRDFRHLRTLSVEKHSICAHPKHINWVSRGRMYIKKQKSRIFCILFCIKLRKKQTRSRTVVFGRLVPVLFFNLMVRTLQPSRTFSWWCSFVR